jgi:hypothetical protein
MKAGEGARKYSLYIEEVETGETADRSVTVLLTVIAFAFHKSFQLHYWCQYISDSTTSLNFQ